MQRLIVDGQLPKAVVIAGRQFNASEIAMAQFFRHGDSMTLLMPYLSYLDCMSLSRAMVKLAPWLRAKIPRFRTVVNNHLTAIGVGFDLIQVVNSSAGVITGSFLLHCLLQPLSVYGYSRIFPPGSDIDLLSEADGKTRTNCPHCLKRLLILCMAPADVLKLDGGRQFNWLIDHGRRRLRLDRFHKPGHVLGALISAVRMDYLVDANGAYHGDTKGYDFPHLTQRPRSKLSASLCAHLTFDSTNRAYQALPIANRNVWTNNSGLKFDDVCISPNKGIYTWMYESVDFGFCHNSFDGTQLRIHKPHQLLKRESRYELDPKLVSIIQHRVTPIPGVTFTVTGDQVLIKTDIKTFAKLGDSPYLFGRIDYHQLKQCYDLLKIYIIRGCKYTERGFKVHFSDKLTSEAIFRFVNNSHIRGDISAEILRLTRQHMS